ncbi:MAG: hypothetical protein DRQ55_16640 [Planctomycetota bacterium]|nr:MAG: hypothetical protein DRQ55_16640 [Planctomycetota bacterium]
MRPFLVRVLINGLTLMGLLLVSQLIRLPGRNGDGLYVFDEPLLTLGGAALFEVLLLGLALALVGVLVRPVLTGLSGSLVVRTYGLMAVLINIIVFWLAVELVTWFTHVKVAVPDPRIIWIVIIGALFSFTLLVVNTLLGLNRPRLRDVGEDQPIWRLLDQLPLSRRNRLIENLRLQQVREIIFEYGIDISLAGTGLDRFRHVGDWLLGRDPDEFDSLETPAKVRIMLQQLGPTYVKVGQMVSSRADVLPQAWRDEMVKLQSDVPPFPVEQVRAVVKSELGRNPRDAFSTFDQEPLGSASLAQVHRATLADGSEVVVKVQRPDVQRMVMADLGNMEDLAQQAEHRVSLARTMNLSAMIHEFGDGVISELDYENEAYNALRLAEICEGLDGIHIPTIYLGYSSRRVITMEYVGGVKATEVEALDAAGVDRDLVARRLIRAMIKQVLVDGFFHGDPHPGNVIIDTADGTINFIDMGLVGELDSGRRLQLMGLMWALRQRDPDGLATSIIGLCEETGPFDEAHFRSQIRRVFYQYWIYGEASFSRLVAAMFDVLNKSNLRLDQALALAVKALVQVEELVRKLSPQLPLVDTGYDIATELVGEQITQERIIEMAKKEATSTAIELVKRMPSLREATLSWVDQYQKGKFVVKVDTSDLQKGMSSIGSASRNLTIGLIIAGQLIALAVVLAVMLLSDAVSNDVATLVVLGFLGFLGFSLLMIRRVSGSS